MEGRVVMLEEKLLEVGEKQAAMESKLESRFNESNGKIDGLSE